jgi:hypothetical protein
MNNFYNWCSKKENIKMMVMAGLAVFLIVFLIHRFSGGNDMNTSASSEAIYENSIESQTQLTKRFNDEKIIKHSLSKTMEFDNMKPPPSITRDIFSYSNAKNKPKRYAEEMVMKDLTLQATIIDDQEPLAIIDNEVLGIGDFVKGFEVTAIKDNEVMLFEDGKNHILMMIKE